MPGSSPCLRGFPVALGRAQQACAQPELARLQPSSSVLAQVEWTPAEFARPARVLAQAHAQNQLVQRHAQKPVQNQPVPHFPARLLVVQLPAQPRLPSSPPGQSAAVFHARQRTKQQVKQKQEISRTDNLEPSRKQNHKRQKAPQNRTPRHSRA